MKRRILFVDRDGTIIAEPSDERIDDLSKFRMMSGALTALRSLQQRYGYELVMVTNQDGLNTPEYPLDSFLRVQNFLMDLLKAEGIVFTEVCIDASTEVQPSSRRKPSTEMLRHYCTDDLDMQRSAVIGDRLTDIQLADALGVPSILLQSAESKAMNADPAHAYCTASSWAQVEQCVRRLARSATIKRVTNESTVEVSIALDGDGRAAIDTGIGFFDHMLEQLVVHSGIDATIRTNGDLHVDEHHSVEDTALAFGEALRNAIGGKYGIARYGFVLPMDEAQARIALDLSGRPFLRWDVPLRLDYLGGMPLDLIEHFFRSLSTTAMITLHVEADGKNDHHIVESVFKGVGRALGLALAETGTNRLPTSKGTL
ncbi:MAG: histidinol-phosphatase [bacterium]|nr:histidinol-phosphatase [bacterium]